MKRQLFVSVANMTTEKRSQLQHEMESCNKVQYEMESYNEVQPPQSEQEPHNRKTKVNPNEWGNE